MGQKSFREARQESGEQMEPGTAAAQWVQGQESDISVEIPAARAPGTVSSLKRLQVSLWKFEKRLQHWHRGCTENKQICLIGRKQQGVAQAADQESGEGD